MLGGKKLHARELSRDQPILRFDIILQHDWPIEQCLLHIRVFFGRKTLADKIHVNNEHFWNHFSRLYKNRSNNACMCIEVCCWFISPSTGHRYFFTLHWSLLSFCQKPSMMLCSSCAQLLIKWWLILVLEQQRSLRALFLFHRSYCTTLINPKFLFRIEPKVIKD